jgi:signal transduction histidine kinase
MRHPLDQDELRTLEAELRQAVQCRRAAVEQLRETQHAFAELLARARGLLAPLESGGERDNHDGGGRASG